MHIEIYTIFFSNGKYIFRENARVAWRTYDPG